MNQEWQAAALICAIALISVLTRSFFFISRRNWALPPAAQTGLRYAPVAALAAVIAPEIVITQGHLISTWMDARLYALAAGLTWFYFRGGVLGTIVAGMAVYLPLHVGLGW